MRFNTIDDGFSHESKIESKGLSCPPLSGFNHLAVFLRWAYGKGLVKEEVFRLEPLLKPALDGNEDIRKVLAKSTYFKGKLRSDLFVDESREFVEWFYNFTRKGAYPDCVDQNAENYFGTEKYNSEEFQDEAYLFVPYDDDYYKNLSKFIDDAYENVHPKISGKSIGKDILDDVLETVRKESETDAVFIETGTGDTNLFSSKFGGLPYWPADKEYPTDSNGNKLLLLAQINLNDVNFDKLPSKGILQFFVANDDIIGLDDEKGSKVVYHEVIDTSITEEDVRNCGIMSNLDLNDDSLMFPFQACFSLSFSVRKDILHTINEGFDDIANRVLNEKYGLNCDFPWSYLCKEDYRYLEKDAPDCNHKMFGHPYFTQGDPRTDIESIEKYDTLLFQLDSEFVNGKPEIIIGDSGIINFFINSKDLENLNFDDVLYNWDCL